MTKFTTIVARQKATAAWVLMSCHIVGCSLVFDCMAAYQQREDFDMVARIQGTADEYADDFFGFGAEWPTDDPRRDSLRRTFRENMPNGMNPGV